MYSLHVSSYEWSLRYSWQILNESRRHAPVTFAMSVPPSVYLLEIIINMEPNTVHKINLGQTFCRPPAPAPVTTCFTPAAASSGRAVLVADHMLKGRISADVQDSMEGLASIVFTSNGSICFVSSVTSTVHYGMYPH